MGAWCSEQPKSEGAIDAACFLPPQVLDGFIVRHARQLLGLRFQSALGPRLE